MNDYEQGQLDLIKHLKEETSKIPHDTKNFMLDFYNIIVNLKPLNKPIDYNECVSVKK